MNTLLDTVICGILPITSSYADIEYSIRGSRVISTYLCPASLTIRGNVEKTCSIDGIWTGVVSPCGRHLLAF